MDSISKETHQSWMVDPKNWRWGGLIYHNAEDPRYFLPKPIAWMGWMVNFAHPKAVLALVLLLIVLLLPVWFLG